MFGAAGVGPLKGGLVVQIFMLYKIRPSVGGGLDCVFARHDYAKAGLGC